MVENLRSPEKDKPVSREALVIAAAAGRIVNDPLFLLFIMSPTGGYNYVENKESGSRLAI